MQSELSYTRKWLQLLDVANAVVRYLAILGIAASRVAPAHLGPELRKLAAPPSDGTWVTAAFGLLESLSAISPDGPRDVIAARAARIDPKALKRARAAANEIVSKRNDTKGHGVTEAEEGYRQLYEANLTRVECLLEFVAPFAALRLLKPVAEIERRGGVGIVAVRVLTGSNPVFATEKIETRSSMDTDCLVYDAETKGFTSLHPWLLFSECKDCFRDMVKFYDGLASGTVKSREFVTNHTQKSPDLYADVRSSFETLLGAGGVEAENGRHEP